MLLEIESLSVMSSSLQPHGLWTTPWTLQLPGQSMEFFRPEHWSGYLFPSPGDLPKPEIKPRSPALLADSLPAEPPGKSFITLKQLKFKIGFLRKQIKHSTTK